MNQAAAAPIDQQDPLDLAANIAVNGHLGNWLEKVSREEMVAAIRAQYDAAHTVAKQKTAAVEALRSIRQCARGATTPTAFDHCMEISRRAGVAIEKAEAA